MSAYPKRENSWHWWLITTQATSTGRLHAIDRGVLTEADMEAWLTTPSEEDSLRLQAACGLNSAWTYPDLGSRYDAQRCAFCCRELGIPRGYGTPVNEDGSKRRAKA